VLTGYIDGVQVATYTLSSAELSKFTATTVGIRQSTAAAVSFDNFTVLSV